MIDSVSPGFLNRVVTMTLLLLATALVYGSDISDVMIDEFKAESVRPFTSKAGMEAWFAAQPNGRSCTTCHGESLEAVGSHQRTGKRIEPMAPSINPERLTDRRKINKWFLRNCKWTYGRECNAQEKGDILLWLSQQ